MAKWLKLLGVAVTSRGNGPIFGSCRAGNTRSIGPNSTGKGPENRYTSDEDSDLNILPKIVITKKKESLTGDFNRVEWRPAHKV